MGGGLSGMFHYGLPLTPSSPHPSPPLQLKYEMLMIQDCDKFHYGLQDFIIQFADMGK